MVSHKPSVSSDASANFFNQWATVGVLILDKHKTSTISNACKHMQKLGRAFKPTAEGNAFIRP